MARPVTIMLSHDLGPWPRQRRGAPACARGSDKLKSGFGGGMMMKFSEEWTTDNRLDFNARGLGQTITGSIEVFPAHIRIHATLPSLLASLAERIAGRVEKDATLLLEKK